MSNDVGSWDKAIADAQAEMVSIERRRRRLRQAIEIFKENKRDGLPWPAAAEKTEP